MPVSVWAFICVVVRASGTIIDTYVNGVLSKSVTIVSRNVSSTSAVSSLGSYYAGAIALTGSMALWRVSATAPSTAQIAKIYRDELPLFQAGAACTLYGTSDQVNALAHDDTTNLLHVGTSAGRSVFDGLRRVSNTTTAVGAAISASNNLIVEE
jgi:hypothetical protein